MSTASVSRRRLVSVFSTRHQQFFFFFGRQNLSHSDWLNIQLDDLPDANQAIKQTNVPQEIHPMQPGVITPSHQDGGSCIFTPTERLSSFHPGPVSSESKSVCSKRTLMRYDIYIYI